MKFYDSEDVEKIIWLWSTGMDVETICDLVLMPPENVNEIIDSVSPYI